ncbi:uncharacterized protein LOC135372731 [Ornithodoros turicata]|uniref:uncharacterized protein LOC135372731 n=1 Tax=Ornithodoros turicata TaxID=34597 RepID=UPI003139B5B7
MLSGGFPNPPMSPRTPVDAGVTGALVDDKPGTKDKTGPCGGRLLPNIYYDPPFSYLAITQFMWPETLARIANTSECDVMHLDQCYQHLIPAYKDDLNRSLCYTTTDTQNAPTFSGVVGFNVDNFCKASATMDGLTAGKGSTVSKSCTTPCGGFGTLVWHQLPWSMQGSADFRTSMLRRRPCAVLLEAMCKEIQRDKSAVPS